MVNLLPNQSRTYIKLIPGTFVSHDLRAINLLASLNLLEAISATPGKQTRKSG